MTFFSLLAVCEPIPVPAQHPRFDRITGVRSHERSHDPTPLYHSRKRSYVLLPLATLPHPTPRFLFSLIRVISKYNVTHVTVKT